MMNFTLDKDSAGFVTIEMKFHESTDLELLFEFIRSQVEHSPSNAASEKPIRKRARSTSASPSAGPPQSTDDLSDNERAVINAAYLLQRPFSEARELLPKLLNDKRFSTRSQDKSQSVRYLVRTLKERDVFVEEGRMRRLSDLGISLARELAGDRSNLPNFEPNSRPSNFNVPRNWEGSDEDQSH